MKKALRRITLHNFQSHADTNLELHAGINIIVGPSDVGKSAVIRALRWLYYNQPLGIGFMRMGTNECWVEVETEDNIIIRRYRNETTKDNGYLVIYPGQEPLWLKSGKGVPEKVKEALGVREIIIDQEVTLKPNIAFQLEGAFLLGQPDSTKAKAIGRIGDAHIVDTAQKEIQKDLRNLNQDIEYKKEQLNKEDNALAKFDYLTDWETRIKQIENYWQRYNDKKSLLHNLTVILIQKQKNTAEEKRITETLVQLNGLVEAENTLIRIENCRYLEEQLILLYQQQMKKDSSYKKQLEILQKTQLLADCSLVLEKLEVLWQKLRQYEQWQQKWNQTRSALDRARSLLVATAHCEEVTAAYNKLLDNKVKLGALKQLQNDYQQKKAALIKAVSRIKATDNLESGEQLIKRLSYLREQGKVYSDNWRAYQQRYKTRHDINQKLSRLSTCETAEGKLFTIDKLNDQLQKLIVLQERWQQLYRQKEQQELQLTALWENYQKDIEQYLELLLNVGECPLCHGRIEDTHLRELRTQLLEEWGNE